MRVSVGSAVLALMLGATTIGAAGPAGAATIVLLPSPGSMSAPRSVSDGTDSKDIYVCTAPSELHGQRCRLQRSAAPHRRG